MLTYVCTCACVNKKKKIISFRLTIRREPPSLLTLVSLKKKERKSKDKSPF